MKPPVRIIESEFKETNPELYECLTNVKTFVSNNATLKDSYIENGYYHIHFEHSHPYFELLVEKTLPTMNYYRKHIELDQIHIAQNYIILGLKPFNQNK